MTDDPEQGSNSVGQSSVLIKRRSRVQVPPALPISDELTDDQLEHVIGGSPWHLWPLALIFPNERREK
jgi:bacteriocin-like protein